jgi:enterochelin esterase-like enzyme
MKESARTNLVIMTALAITLILGVTGSALAGAVVNADNTVTFTMQAAPKTETMTVLYSAAADVTKQMVKTGNVFTYTTDEALAPNWYRYCFFVDGLALQDGMRMADPVNADHYFSENGRLWSFFLVAGDETDFLETKDVPHGTVSQVWYHSSLTNSWRTMWVYTPPGYNKNDKKYPVLYLHHGSGNTGQEWVFPSRANFILDNLIAVRKAVPMIIVMPTHHGLPTDPDPALDPYPVKELLGSIVPTIEKQFRVLPGSENRAMAGLSMGGGRTFQALVQIPKYFDYFCPLSMGWSAENITTLESNHKNLLLALGANRNIKLIWIAMGNADGLMSRIPGTLALLDKYRIEYTYHETEGAHMPDVWRHNFYDFSQLLFREDHHGGNHN